MFYFTGKKHTTPNCPVELHPDLNPSSGAQSYVESNNKCSHGATYHIPFFLNNAGPRFSEWSVNAHEARPGHHTQVEVIFIINHTFMVIIMISSSIVNRRDGLEARYNRNDRSMLVNLYAKL